MASTPKKRATTEYITLLLQDVLLENLLTQESYLAIKLASDASQP
jgi:hypothetical protein